MQQNGMPRRDFMKGAMLGGAGIGLAGAARAQDESYGDAAPPPASAGGGPQAAPGQKVPRRKFGKTGVEIPIMLLGCSQTFDPKYDKLLHRCFDMGVDYLDTAEVYAAGKSHETIAPFLQQVGRKNVWVTSKASLKGSKATPDNYKNHCQNCLDQLQTDYLDMFFMHMIDDLGQLEPDFIKMGDDLKKAGKIKFFGFSCHDGNVAALLEKAAKVGGIDGIMFRYNFRQYGDVELNKAVDAAHEAGIGLIAMKTQSSVPDDLEKVVQFQSKNFTLGQAKLKSVWEDDRLAAAVSHITNLQLLQENGGAAMSPEKLSMNEFHQLNKLARMTSSHHCMGCKHICETKVAGELRIADALRYLMYADSYHDPEKARLLYNALSPMERNFDGIDLSAATAACPQGIQIEHRLQAARQMLLA